jgi:DNA-binding transcriptional LysR family regulator
MGGLLSVGRARLRPWRCIVLGGNPGRKTLEWQGVVCDSKTIAGMDRISPLRAFVEAARLASFSAAARKLDLARDQISKQIAGLEAELGTALFTRSTRRVTLTSAGEALFGRAETIVALVDETMSELRSLAKTPRGTLRVNAPMSFSQRYLAPLLPAFHAAYPEVQLRLDLDDQFVDPAASGADVTLRVAQLPEHLDLVAVPLATAPRWLVAAPAYLKAAGEPARPADLARHACLHYGDPGAQAWQFRPAETGTTASRDAVVSVVARGPVCSNNGDVLLQAARDGLGLTVLPAFMLRDEVRAGRLRQVLRDWIVTPDIGIFALYSRAARTSPAVRAFVSVIEAGLKERLGSGDA